MAEAGVGPGQEGPPRLRRRGAPSRWLGRSAGSAARVLSSSPFAEQTSTLPTSATVAPSSAVSRARWRCWSRRRRHRHPWWRRTRRRWQRRRWWRQQQAERRARPYQRRHGVPATAGRGRASGPGRARGGTLPCLSRSSARGSKEEAETEVGATIAMAMATAARRLRARAASGAATASLPLPLSATCSPSAAPRGAARLRCRGRAMPVWEWRAASSCS